MRFVRFLYALLVLGSGAVVLAVQPLPHGLVLIGAGLLVLLASFLVEARFRRSTPAARETLAGGAGLLLGILIGMVTIAAVDELPIVAVFSRTQANLASAVWVLFLCMLGYIGLVAGQVMARGATARPGPEEDLVPRTRYLLGEKALVDGRAIRLAQSPLLSGEIVVPRYVVDALQSMAASKNPLEHFRGERGLENLRSLQQVPNRPVRIREIDIARGETEGLLEFAQRHDTRLVIQSTELLAEAARRGVPAIDLNALGDLLKPDVVQGDELVVKLVKPGKERDQAVGYLEDGNMVVVENGREDLGRTVRIVVTGIHQTRAGTLIFGAKREPVASRGEPIAQPGSEGEAAVEAEPVSGPGAVRPLPGAVLRPESRPGSEMADRPVRPAEAQETGVGARDASWFSAGASRPSAEPRSPAPGPETLAPPEGSKEVPGHAPREGGG